MAYSEQVADLRNLSILPVNSLHKPSEAYMGKHYLLKSFSLLRPPYVELQKRVSQDNGVHKPRQVGKAIRERGSDYHYPKSVRKGVGIQEKFICAVPYTPLYHDIVAKYNRHQAVDEEVPSKARARESVWSHFILQV